MKKFSICVTETSRAYYVVEAESAAEAEELFEEKRGADYNFELNLERDLERGYQGCELSVVDAEDDKPVDFTYAELKGAN